jgi:D-tagatose-1,6-bisphosphate aldolase subunit GatZ/KbaZ
MTHPLRQVLKGQNEGRDLGIYSICSANPFVLRAGILQAKHDDSCVLIESTSNQVDQFGGYTGNTPKQFSEYVLSIASELNFPPQRVILGGDHLGPNVWRSMGSVTAMDNARVLVKSYVEARFEKIHLDASMRCADDKSDDSMPLDEEIAVERTAVMCQVCEETMDRTRPLHYVIGTEVPVPGGETEQIESVEVTTAERAQNTIEMTRRAFLQRGLEGAWQRVIAVVVQPGVDFGDSSVVRYHHEKAVQLTKLIGNYENLVYEAHSTDYQTEHHLKELVADGFAILKVGPWLTYAFREAVFALAHIENELNACGLLPETSNLIQVADSTMLENPKYWQGYYHGSKSEQAFARKFSQSDRIRYYWPERRLQASLNHLIRNLTQHEIPVTLLSQFLPKQCDAVRAGLIRNHPGEIIHHKIMEITKVYSNATSMNKLSMN